MKITSINIGKAQAINAKSGQSGIFKQPISEAVTVTELGLQGDTIVDTENHGGIGQAVYIYGQPDYDWWSNELDTTLAAGTFGENLTISALVSSTLCIGDTLQMGTVTLQVTSPRIPCVTLATRMGDPQFVKKFMDAGRYGAYCRVLQTGEIKTGDVVTITPYTGEHVTLKECIDAYNSKPIKRSTIERMLNLPISVRGRQYWEAEIAKLDASE